MKEEHTRNHSRMPDRSGQVRLEPALLGLATLLLEIAKGGQIVEHGERDLVAGCPQSRTEPGSADARQVSAQLTLPAQGLN